LHPKFAEFLQLADDIMAALTLVEHQLVTGDRNKVVCDGTLLDTENADRDEILEDIKIQSTG